MLNYQLSNVEDAYPLAALQIGMLFHSKYNPDSLFYHNVSSFFLKVAFNEEKLRLAIQDIADRHAVLRTSFDLKNFSEPLQLVYKKVCVPLEIEDLRHLSLAQQEQNFNTFFEAEKKRHFNWSIPPLLRFHVHRLSQETFQLTLTEHHAILDGWSVASMLTELFQQYLYLLNQEVSPLPPPPAISFRDFIALERETLESEECRRFWIQKLNHLTITKLPQWIESDHSTKIEQVGELEVPISTEVFQSLKQLAQVANVPLKSVLLAVHLKVLSVLSNQQDILTGLVSNGRPEVNNGERVLGLFLNTLPFRLKLLEGSWIALAQTTFKTEQELLPYRRFPLAKLQQIIHKNQPLFDIVFNFTHFHTLQSVLKFGDLEILDGKFFRIGSISRG